MAPALRDRLAETTFRLVRSQTRLAGRLGLPVLSTGRPFAFYRTVFFAGRPEQEVLAELAGRVVVDVGCGLTPFVPDSFFQACLRAGVDIYGADPKLTEGFSLGRFHTLTTLLNRGGVPDPRAPGAERRLAVRGDALPFDDAAVDLVVSSWLLFVWLTDERALEDVFAEVARVLRPGGELRVYPTPPFTPRAMGRRLFDAVSANFGVTQRFLGGADVVNLPPAYATRFRRLPT